MTRVFLFAVALLAVGSASSLAQDRQPVDRQRPTRPAATRTSLPVFETIVKMAEQIALEDEESESARAGKQITAPSSSALGASLVDAPSFTELIALAFQNDLLASANGTFTINLNAWAFKQLANPRLDMLQDHYGRKSNMRLRRLGGSLSMGGKGEEFDRDGDGKKDAPVEAKNLTDAVTAEVRWRFWGTRDRRERRSLRAYTERMKTIDEDLRQSVHNLAVAIDQLLQRDISEQPILQPCGPPSQADDLCLYEDRLPALFALVKAELPEALKSVGEVLDKWEAQHERAIKMVDRQAIWTLALVNTRRQVDFGANKIGIGLRGLVATGPWDHMVNIDWARTDWRQYGGIGRVAKVGYAASRLLSRDPEADAGVKVTFELAGEKYNNVPGAKHDKLAKASIRLDVPLTDSVTVPFSLNYASHADLLTDQHLLTAHVGIAWDLAALSKRKKN
jgi:hypothetical protein